MAGITYEIFMILMIGVFNFMGAFATWFKHCPKTKIALIWVSGAMFGIARMKF